MAHAPNPMGVNSRVELPRIRVENISRLDFHQVGYTDSALFFDALPRCDARETRHRAGARVGQLHVVGRRSVPEDQVAKAIVAPAVPALALYDWHATPEAEALRDEQFGLLLRRYFPGLPLVVAHLETAELAVERDSEALERHMRVEGIRHG